MIIEIANSVGRLALTCSSIFLVTHLRHMLNFAERLGLGMVGAGSFLTIAVIWERQNSPFDGWAVTLLTYGALLFFCGFGWRKVRHDRANHDAARMARRYLEARGKL